MLVPDGVDSTQTKTVRRFSQYSMLDKHLAGSNGLHVPQYLNLLQTPIQRPWHYGASMLCKLECGMYSVMHESKKNKNEN